MGKEDTLKVSNQDQSIQIEGYRVRELIHSGRRSRVVRALRGDDQSVVLKLVAADARGQDREASLRNEYEIGKDLDNKYVIRCLSIEQSKQGPILVLEDTSSTSLDQMIPQQGFPVGAFLDMAIQIVRGLEAIHNAGVIHRDIKPSNIVRNGKKGLTKIIDFSSSTHLDPGQESSASKGPIGTLAYMAPEQTGRMGRKIDHRSDLYGLGVTFYELLTGQRPFRGNDDLELIHAHLARIPSSPSRIQKSIPETLSDIVLKLLSKDPADRYQTASGLLADLTESQRQWREKGRISVFPPGASDLQEGLRLTFTRTPWTEATESIHQTLKQSEKGKTQCIIVRGEPGTGKTSFVREFLTYASANKGTGLYGIADSVRADTPYFPLSQALRGLLRQILMSGAEDIERWRQSLSKALGNNGKVLEDLLPELPIILGEQPEIPELAPTEAKNRFQHCLLQLIQSIADSFSFVLLVLDDMHLCDRVTAEFIPQLLAHPDTHHLTLLWISQDSENEATTDEVPQRIRESGVEAGEVVLSPFGLEAVQELLAESLYCSHEEIRDFAQTVHEKTKGYPLFLQQFLSSLHSKKIIEFNHKNRRWTWDIRRIEQEDITENVAAYLSGSLEKLASEHQEILQKASTIGAEFDIELLCLLDDSNALDTIQSLIEPIREGFVTVIDGSLVQLEKLLKSGWKDVGSRSFRFSHDSIRQAAYERNDPSERSQNHLRIGQVLKERAGTDPGEKIFEIVRHLNIATELMATDEKIELATLDLYAGKLARDQGAPGQAQALLSKSLDILGEKSWDAHYSLCLDTHCSAAEAALLGGDVDQVRKLETLVREHGKSLDRFKSVHTLLSAYTFTGNHKEAIEFGQTILGELGVHLPAQATKFSGLVAIIRTKLLMSGKKLSQFLKYKEMDDPVQLLITEVISMMTISVYLTQTEYLPHIIYELLRRTVKYGSNDATPAALGLYGIICLTLFGQTEYGYQLGKLSLEVMAKRKTMDPDIKTILVFESLLRPWKEPYRNSLDAFPTFYSVGMEIGNFEGAGLCLEEQSSVSFLSNLDLKHVEEITRKNWHLLGAYGHNDVQIVNYFWYALSQGLRHGDLNPKAPDGELLDELSLHEDLKKEKNDNGLFLLYWTPATLYFFLKNQKKAEHYVNEVLKYTESSVGLTSWIPVHFYRSMLSLEKLSEPDCPNVQVLKKEINKHHKQVKKAASHCPENFGAMNLMIEARIAWADQDYNQAYNFLQEAIKHAEKNGIIREEAYAYELSARLFLLRDELVLAGASFRQAIDLYHRWGATYVADKLEEECSKYLYISSSADKSYTATTTSTSTETGDEVYLSGYGDLDFLTITKSALAISQEINMDQLLVRILSICAESAGAERGKLLIKTKKGWILRASYTNNECKAVEEPLDGLLDLSTGIVRYVIRTDEDIVIGDAQNHHLFSEESYVVKEGLKSVVCVRLRHKSETRGLLYLENNLTFGAFTRQRQEVLRVLLSHASVSVENTALFEDTVQLNVSLEKHRDHLEELVEERTRELKEAQASLIEASRRAGMADVATGVLHNVGNVLNSVNVSSEIIRKIITESRTEALARGVDLIEEHQDDLVSFFTENSKGKKVPLLFRHVSNALEKDKEHVLENLDGLAENIEHIKKIVATQQDYASFSGMVEQFNLAEIIEDAIQINHSLFEKNQTKIVKEFNGTGSIESDKHKVLQILVNLLNNAGHAVHESGKDNPCITIEIAEDTQDKIQINITDNGIGIPEENLSKIFTYGFTTRKDGHGFGLHTSGNSAKELGGNISAESEGPGKGSVFSFLLPRK